MAAPVFNALASTTYASRANLTTVDKPVGTFPLDILLASVVYGQAGSDPGASAITPPSGFTAVAASAVVSAAGFYVRFQVFWKRAGSSEPSTYDFTYGGTFTTQIVLSAYSGAFRSGSPVNVFSTNSGSGTTSTGTSVDPTDIDTLLVLAGHCWNADGSSPPTGFTERFDFVVTLYDAAHAPDTATGNITHTPNGTIDISNPWQSWLIALTFSPDVDVFLAGTPLTATATVIPDTVSGVEATTSTQSVAAGGSTLPAFRSMRVIPYQGRPYSMTILKPSPLSGKDIIIASTFIAINDPIVVGVVTPPAGWEAVAPPTEVFDVDVTFRGVFQCFWKRATSSEPDSYTFTFTETRASTVVLVAYSGCVNTETPIEVVSTAQGYGLISAMPSITTVSERTKLLMAAHGWQQPGHTTPPVDWVERVDDIVTCFDRDWIWPAPSGDISWTPNNNIIPGDPWQAWLMVLVPDQPGDVDFEVTGVSATTSTGSAVWQAYVGVDGSEMEIRIGRPLYPGDVLMGTQVLTSSAGSLGAGSISESLRDAWDWQRTTLAIELTNGDRTATAPAGISGETWSTTSHAAGRYYAEVVFTADAPDGVVGLFDADRENGAELTGDGDVNIYVGGVVTEDYPGLFDSLAIGDVVGIAADLDVGKIWFRVNGGLWNNGAQSPEGEAPWPDETNTGVPDGTVLTDWTDGLLTASDGQIIDAYRIPNGLLVLHDNVVITRCEIITGPTVVYYGIESAGVNRNTTIEDCTIIGPGAAATSTSGIACGGTFRRNNISGWANGMSILDGASIVEDNYIHDLYGYGDDPHVDGIEVFGGANNLLIQHNVIYAFDTFTLNISDLYGVNTDVRVINNKLLGQPGTFGPGYHIWLYGLQHGYSNILISNNRMDEGVYGYYSFTGTDQVVIGNTDAITGEPVPWP
jgi:hypothetical protein